MRRILGVVLVGVCLVGCATAPPDESSPAPVAPSSSSTTWPSYCQSADSRIIGMITSQFNLGGQPPFNPSVVQFSPDRAIVAFGSVNLPISAYLTDIASDDPSKWILVQENDVDYWDRVNLPADIVAAGRPAAQLAIGCVKGG